MSTDQGHEPKISALIEAYTAFLDGRAPRPVLDEVEPEMREEVLVLFGLLDASWRVGADLPPLNEDPVAVALGFVTPRELGGTRVPVQLDGGRLRQARKRRGMKVSDLVRALHLRGLETTPKRLAQTEMLSAAEVELGFAVGLADVLGTSVSELCVAPHADADDFVTWLNSSEFDAEVSRWAKTRGRNIPEAVAAVRTRMLVVQLRSSGAADQRRWVAVLRTVLDGLS
jgi:transcriptional regulator with XRE-family HTH domain